MHHHGQAPGENGEGQPVILVGNPNAGKSVVFGWLTGRYVEVSNDPGTTVEVARGTMMVADDRVPLIDTPGTNSLSPRSDDERVTRDILLVESRARSCRWRTPRTCAARFCCPPNWPSSACRWRST